MRKVLYRFFDKFSLVDLIFIIAIVGLGTFSWSKYQDNLEITKRLATQKLLIASDVEVKSMQSWFSEQEKSLEKLTQLYTTSSNSFSTKLKELKLDTSIINIYLTAKDGTKIFNLKDDSTTIDTSKLSKTLKPVFLGFHQDKDFIYGVLTQSIFDKENNFVASLSIKFNATYIQQLFHTQSLYKSYLYDSNYFIVSQSKKMDTQLVIAFEADKRIDQHIFDHFGLEQKEVVGSYTPLNLYGYELFIVNEIDEDLLYKANYESRDKILLVLVGAIFFALYMMMYLYKKRVRTANSSVEKEEVKKEVQPEQKVEQEIKKEPVLLWDTTAFKAQFTDMEDMMETIISLFREDTPIQLKALQDAVDAQDYKNIKHFAHTIKGSAANLSAVEIVKQAQALEKLALSSADKQEISVKHKAFMQCCLDTMQLMEDFSVSQESEMVVLSSQERIEQLKQLKNSLENSAYIEDANYTLLKLNEDSIIALKHAIDSFNTSKALELIDEMLKKEDK